MTDPNDARAEISAARQLVHRRGAGVLSTHSEELAGYPFGSLTPYSMTHDGNVALFVSAIAEHTANMRADPKVCLTVVESGSGNQQALGRVTLVGDAEPVPEGALEPVRERYFSLFPDARHYGQAHSFEFFWLVPRRVRYIAGFGRMGWVESDEWGLPNPEWSPGEERILEHMNGDHAEAVRAIAARLGADVSEGARMAAVDPQGCHVLAGGACVYAPFEGTAHTEDELRAEMIALSRAAQ